MVLCENGLASRHGHHFNLVAGVRDELARRGVPLTVLANIALAPALRRELDATAAFELTPYTDLRRIGRVRQLKSSILAGSKFAAGLRRTEIGPSDVVLVLTARPAELLGLARWGWTRRRLPRAIVLNFMIDDLGSARTPASPALTRLLYRLGFAFLRLRVGRRRLLLTCASESLASGMSRELRERVIVAPMLKSYPAEPVRRDGANPVIGFLGTPRPEKGEALLARVIDACAFWLPDARVVAQLPPDFCGPPHGWPENVDPMPVALDRDAYFELLGRLDLVVLPYRSDMLGDTPSGVFAEAVACGAATVVPAESWMATMIGRGRAAGLVFDKFDVTAIVGATVNAAAKLDELRRQAASLQTPWRVEQSISAYFERLIEELEAVRCR